MTETEAFGWRCEQHPPQSSTRTVLMTLDAVPERNRWQAVHERATGQLPRTRARVQEPALPIGLPRWVPDPHFDLDYHVRRVCLPSPGRTRQLLEFAQRAAMTPFDRTRPLWEATLIEGLPDGKAAYLLKVHRSLAEGPGAPQLPAAGRLLTSTARALGRPQDTAAGAADLAVSLRHTVASLAEPGSPLFRGRTGTAWRFGVLEFRLADLDKAARAAAGSIPDAYLAALLGGMRRYHDQHDIELDQMLTAFPAGAGPIVTTVTAPLGLDDPRERIAAVRGIRLALGVEPILDILPLLLPVFNHLPSAVGTMTRRRLPAADLCVSYPPGEPHGRRLAGAAVERLYRFEPLLGAAVRASAISYAGVCCIGLVIDGSAVADPDKLVSCLQDGFDEVLAGTATRRHR